MLLVCPAMAVPPVATVYHRYCPAVPPAPLSVRLAATQEAFPVVVGVVGFALTVIVTDVVNTSLTAVPEILHR